MHMSPGLHDSSSFIFLSLLIERIKINFFMQPQNECIFDTKYSPLLFNLSQVLIGVCIIGVSLCAAAVQNMFVQCRYSTIQCSTVHSGATPLLRGSSRKNIFCQKIFDNFFNFQATEMVLTSKWGRIQPEIQI